MNEFPCECGHKKEDHDWSKYLVCESCFKQNRYKGIKQLNSIDCREFKTSNLRYLESKLK